MSRHVFEFSKPGGGVLIIDTPVDVIVDTFCRRDASEGEKEVEPRVTVLRPPAVQRRRQPDQAERKVSQAAGKNQRDGGQAIFG